MLIPSGRGVLLAEHHDSFGVPSRIAAHLLTAVTLANTVGSFVQCGPIACAENPIGYWLSQRVGRWTRNEQTSGRQVWPN